MNKKIWIVSIVWTMILASCWANAPENSTSSVPVPDVNTSTVNDASPELQIVEINKSYLFWEHESSIVWFMALEDWIVKTIEFPWSQWASKIFAENIWDQVIWKSLNWLKIDTISWASGASDAFNDFLTELDSK